MASRCGPTTLSLVTSDGRIGPVSSIVGLVASVVLHLAQGFDCLLTSDKCVLAANQPKVVDLTALRLEFLRLWIRVPCCPHSSAN